MYNNNIMTETLSLQNNNTIIFTIARMNPPTPGHLLLIQKLIEEAIKQNVPKVYVILSKTNDNNENPIDCPEKINILSEHADTVNNMVKVLKNRMKTELDNEKIRSKIDRIEVIFLCVRPDQPSPIFPLFDIVREHSHILNLNLFMIVGDDRADFLDTIADSFLFKNEKINSVNGEILAREDMDTFKKLSDEELSEIDISEVPISAFSASFVRKLVKLGMKDKFNDVYRPYLSPEQIDHLYDLIFKGLKKPEPKSTSSSSAVNPLKYEYPIIKGVGKFNQYYEIYLVNERIKEEKKKEREEEKIRKEEEKRKKQEDKILKEMTMKPNAVKRKLTTATAGKEEPSKVVVVEAAAAEAELGGSRSKRRKTKRKSRKRRKLTKNRKSKRRLTKRRN